MPSRPILIETQPIVLRHAQDGREPFDGRYQLVFADGHDFAIARWSGDRWAFSSGAPLDFEPTEYRHG